MDPEKRYSWSAGGADTELHHMTDTHLSFGQQVKKKVRLHLLRKGRNFNIICYISNVNFSRTNNKNFWIFNKKIFTNKFPNSKLVEAGKILI